MFDQRDVRVGVIGGHDPREPGGLESVVGNIARYSSDRYNFIQYCSGSRTVVEPSDLGEIYMYSNKIAGIESKHIYSLKAARDLQRRKVDLVHGHGDNCLGPALYDSSKPYVVTFHGTVAGLYDGLYPRKSLARWFIAALRPIPEAVAARQCDVAVACSEKVRNELIKYYKVDQSKITVINNGVDIESFQPISRRRAKQTLELDSNVRYITWVGNAPLRKGLRTAERTIELLDPDIELLVAGIDGENTDTTTYLGRVEQRLMKHVYSAGEVFLFPSVYEGFPLSVIEPLACGTPVVASPFMPTIDHDVCYTKCHEPSAYAETLRGVLSKETDREQIRQRSLQHDWKERVEEYMQVYEQLPQFDNYT